MRVPDKEAGEYFDWLQDNIGPLARLADLTSEMGFGPKDTLQALESVLGTRHRFHLRPDVVAGVPDTGPAQPPPPPAASGRRRGGSLLGCAEHVKLRTRPGCAPKSHS